MLGINAPTGVLISYRNKRHLNIIVVCLCWYAISSFGSQVTKTILTECPLPLFLGEFQFLFISLLACLTCFVGYYWPFFRRLYPDGTFPQYDDRDTSIITRPSKDVLRTVLPLGFFQFVGKYFGHRATSLVPVSTVASIKTLSPVFIVIAQKLLNRTEHGLNKGVYFSLLCVITGVWVIVYSDNHTASRSISGADMGTNDVSQFSHVGVIFANISMLIFVVQNIHAKTIFTSRKEELPISSKQKYASAWNATSRRKYDKLTLMIFISMVGFMMSLGWFVTLELPIVWSVIFGLTDYTISWNLIILNGTLHFLQSMITFYLLGEISTLSYSIANIMKRIAIISFSWVSTSHNITGIQILGMLLNVSGLFFYERFTTINAVE